jgi:hypothetical protein
VQLLVARNEIFKFPDLFTRSGIGAYVMASCIVRQQCFSKYCPRVQS